MTLVTTTLPAIISNYATLIKALGSLSYLPTVGFNQCPTKYPLRQWAIDGNQGSAVLRKFELVITGSADEPPFFSPDAIERNEEITLSVAYPVQPSLYGASNLYDLQTVARYDARILRDVLESSDSYISGQNATDVTITPLDKTDEDVWFLDLVALVRYYEVQSL